MPPVYDDIEWGSSGPKGFFDAIPYGKAQPQAGAKSCDAPAKHAGLEFVPGNGRGAGVRLKEMEMRRSAARELATALVCLVIAAPAALAWEVKERGNPIDPTSKTPFAAVPAAQPFSQLGRKVTARFLVTCGVSADGKSKALQANLAFSEAAALSQRPVTWRIDPRNTGKGLIWPYPTGTVLTFGQYGSEQVIRALLESRSAEIDIDLPWAGQVHLRFGTAGAKESFSKIPCSGPAT